MNSKGQKVLSNAVRDIGYRKGADGTSKYGKWYGKGFEKEPYCMMAVQYWYTVSGIPLPHLTASCGALLRWYQKNQPECIVGNRKCPYKNPAPGAVIIFDFPRTKNTTDHTGLFESADGASVTSVDGNTANGNDSNGGWVMRRTRKLKDANPTYIIPHEIWDIKDDAKEEDGIDMTIDQFISQMTPEQAYKLIEKAQAYAGMLPLPKEWDAKTYLDKAVADRITDGTRPMALATRLEVSLMADRALGKR